jgi:siroheme synthase
VLMGIANAGPLRDQLIAAGRAGDTPAAVIEWGTCARQRVVVGTLATLPGVIARDALGAPAVIVIGDTVGLRSRLEWFTEAAWTGQEPDVVEEARACS